jgi:zinc protease
LVEHGDPLRMARRPLDCGLELTLQRGPSSAQSFSLSYVAPAGWGFDPPGLVGLATVAAKLLVTRPGNRSREETARTLDRLGASLSSAVAPESAEVTLWGPYAAWAPLVELFADAILSPTFDANELDRVRRQLVERQLRERVQPDLRAERELVELLYPAGHPYHSTGSGTARTASRISTAALGRFHRSHYPTRGAVLAATVPAPAKPLTRALERRFHAASLRADPARPSLDDSPARARRRDVPIPGQSQVAVRLGARAVSRSHPEYPELYLLNEVLGGRPLLSRLFQRIRERHGLAYHASSELEAMRWGGYWSAYAGTDPAKRERVVRLMLGEVARLASEPVGPAELERIRESALGSLPLELETTASAHELAVDVAYHRLPTDFYRTWPARLRRIRARELRAVAERALPAEHLVIVTAGPPPVSDGRPA